MKQHLLDHFQTKESSLLKFFLDIEVSQSGCDIIVSQREGVCLGYPQRSWHVRLQTIGYLYWSLS